MKAVWTVGVLAVAMAGTGSAAAADLATGVVPAPAVAAPVWSAPAAPIMVSPVRSRFFKPIQTHVVAQPAPNPRAILEGPVIGPAPPVIIVVKPSGP